MFLKKYWLGLVGLILLVGGIIFASYTFAAQNVPEIEYRQPVSLPAPTVNATEIRPTRLLISRLALDVLVAEGEFDMKDQSWKLDRQHAFYLEPGQPPLQTRSWPLIYGHARSEIFASLAKAERGEILSVTSDDGRVFTYTLSGSVSVEPEQGAILNTPPEGQGLQLLTCEGFNFEKRRILYFTFIAEEQTQKGITI